MQKNYIIRIATWNICGGLISDNKNISYDVSSIEYYIEALKNIKPDIICLQEVHVATNLDQAQMIASALGYKFVTTKVIAKSHMVAGQKLAISIVSKYKIMNTKFHKLPNPDLEFTWKGQKANSHDKGILEAKIVYQNSVVRIISSHTVPFHRFDRDAMDTEFNGIRDKFEKIILKDELPIIVGADINFHDARIFMPAVFQQGFSTSLGESPTRPRGRKTDEIIYSKEFSCVSAKIVESPTDHFLCYADLKMTSL